MAQYVTCLSDYRDQNTQGLSLHPPDLRLTAPSHSSHTDETTNRAILRGSSKVAANATQQPNSEVTILNSFCQKLRLSTKSVLPLLLVAAHCSSLPADDLTELRKLSDKLVQTRTANRAKLGNYKICWKTTTEAHNYYPGRESTYSASYAMWKKDNQMAVSSVRDSYVSSRLERDYHSCWETWSGGEWRQASPMTREHVRQPFLHQPVRVTISKEHDLASNEDWFQSVGWRSGWRFGLDDQSAKLVSLFDTYLREHATAFSIEAWKMTDAGVLDATFFFPSEKARIRFQYDLARGGELTEQFYEEGNGASSLLTYDVAEVQPGFWVPVLSVHKEVAADKTRWQTHRHEMDTQTSGFGPDVEIDQRVFQIPISNGIEVVDLRHQNLKKSLPNNTPPQEALAPPLSRPDIRWILFLINGVGILAVVAVLLYKNNSSRSK